MHTTGTNSATIGNIPTGTTLMRAYWAVPGYGSIGAQFADQAAALRTAIDATQAAVGKHNNHYAPDTGTAPTPKNSVIPLPQRITLDLRWILGYPEGGGTDIVMSRIEYDDIADAQYHLNLLDKFAPAAR